MTEPKGIIAAAQDTLKLFRLMAADFQPRTHKQIVELAARSSCDWSAGKISNMLTTLDAEGFLRQSPSGEWTIHPQITAIAINFHESIVRRSQAIMDEVAETKTISERMK